jgi:hypothetical protein
LSGISRKGWYQNLDVSYEIVKCQMGGRETVFLPFKVGEDGKLTSTPPVRWLLCNCLKFLNMQWDRYKFLDSPMNLYHSLAVYTQLPRFSWSYRVKSQEQMVWMQEFKNYIKSYDCFLETDSDDIKLSHADAVDIKRFLDRYKVVYSLKFSGSKGFHQIIPAEEFDWLSWKTYDEVAEQNVRDFRQLLIGLPVGLDGNNGNITLDKVLLFKIMALRLKTLLSADTIDTSVQDLKRITKTPYSWDCKSGRIALPLTDSQFSSFDKSICDPLNVLRGGVHKRGLLWRNTEVPKEERQALSKKMLQDLGILK